ncbi:MAG: SBBP repeat-containing protein [Armatimonadetes bacterium]|nr:SBBP repeat-containing protein [Armatimonadota bacterium]
MPHQSSLPRILRACPAALALALTVSAGAAQTAAVRTPRLTSLPVSFEKNTGHYPGEVQFVARTSGGTLFLTRREAVLALRRGGKEATLRLKLHGAKGTAQAFGLGKQSGIVNHFDGSDPRQWRTNVPTYSRVKLAGVYPGIDLVYYGAGNGRALEYDFVVKPGADPGRIRVAASGAKSLRAVGGRLIASTECGDVVLNRPYAYQTINGARQRVACSFRLERTTVSFQVARYDTTRPLVVDPTLEYCSYLGSTSNDYAYGIAVDAAGAAYVCGATSGDDFPATPGAYQTAHAADGGFGDAFVAKLNAAGAGLVYSTYIGGLDGDYAKGIAVDAVGAAYVCGETTSSDFPTTPGAYQRAFGGRRDGFVVKLTATGSTLVFSTYLGGINRDYSEAVAVDAAGSVYVCGYANNAGYPTTAGAFQRDFAGGRADVVVTKLNSDGASLLYSTYLGGSNDDEATGIAVDASGAAYVGGFTISSAFPTTPGAYQTVFGGGSDAFVTKLNDQGTALVYSTYLGGSGLDYGVGLAVDVAGQAVVSGNALQPGYPTTPGAYQTNIIGAGDVFVSKLNPAGSGLVYSTLVGGTGFEELLGSAVDATGAVTLCGETQSTDYATTPDAFQSVRKGASDGYLTRLNAAGTDLIYSTYLGGTQTDTARSLALGAGGAVYVCGNAGIAFPTTAGAFRTTAVGGDDAFVSKFVLGPPPPALAVDSLNATVGSSISLRGRLTEAGGAAIGGQRLQFSIDAGSWTNSEVLTSAAGYATLTIVAPSAGSHTVACRFEAAAGYPAASGSGTLSTTDLTATTVLVQDCTAGPGDGFSLSAYLQLQDRSGIAGKSLEFQFNGGVWTPASALTDAAGKGALAVTAPAASGTYAISARFAGDAAYAVAGGTANLTVAAKRNVYIYTINRTGKVGAAGTLIAYFYWYQKNGTLTPVSGKPLRFQCAGAALDSTVTSDASGKATVSVTPASAGAFPFNVTFAADAEYNTGSGSGTLTVAP